MVARLDGSSNLPGSTIPLDSQWIASFTARFTAI